MAYSYFGNTSAKESKLLINIEAHLILLDKLFQTATKDDIWKSNSSLQLRYAKILEDSHLLNTNEMNLIAKNARTKVAFLRDLGLVNFEKLEITNLGKELLYLLNSKKFEEKSDFLQIDLVSMFFLKNFFAYKKDSDIDNMFLKYLYIFKIFNGKLSNQQFYLLPLISNYENINDFIEILKNENLNLVNTFRKLIYKESREQKRRNEFLNDYKEHKTITNLSYFATSKGTNFVKELPKILKIFMDIFYKKYNKDDVRTIFKNSSKNRKNYFKELYLPTLLETKNIAINSKTYLKLFKKLFKEIRKNRNETQLLNYFFDLIYLSRYFNNLKDYQEQNKYYLDLTGIFSFENEEAKVSEIFNVILQSNSYQDILSDISSSNINQSSLNHLFENSDIKEIFKSYGISNSFDLNNFQYNQNKKILENLLSTKFTKKNITKIISNFNNRKDDDIQKSVTIKATAPTIFEYIVAIAWYYIDNKNIDFILKAGLSLDANMLPKSHAVGGSSDFEIIYNDHTLMIEVTLTEKTNQRRAEMESVSRHLGNILLNLDEDKRNKSYGIFIAPHLDNNVLNDFRIRKNCYFENKTSYIKGMNILPLNCDDLIQIINSEKTYQELKNNFYKLFEEENL